jgi:hypothetical protein
MLSFSCDLGTRVSLNEGNDFPLSFRVMLDIPDGRLKARMSSELLHVAKRSARLTDLPRRPGDKGSSPGMRGAADHPEVSVKPMKPHSDGTGGQTAITLTVDHWPIWTCLLAPRSIESHKGSFDIGMRGNVTASSLTL